MRAEFVDVNETRKTLSVEIPSELVDAEIERVARDYSRKARIPGFRPGKVPARVVRQRFKDQILHDVAHDLVPRAVDEALREKGVEPVSTPSNSAASATIGRCAGSSLRTVTACSCTEWLSSSRTGLTTSLIR